MVIYTGPFNLFFHTVPLRRGGPLIETSSTTEVVEPYRRGRCVIVKVWPGKGWVFGRWTGVHEDEETALVAAVAAHMDTALDDAGKLQRRYAREAVARSSKDPTDEWEILSALDLTGEDR